MMADETFDLGRIVRESGQQASGDGVMDAETITTIADRMRQHGMTADEWAAHLQIAAANILYDGNPPRAIIRHFAAAMERKLALRDETHGSWRQSDMIELMDALLHEAEELRAAWVMHSRYDGSTQDVLMEAVDVAAYAMFIADVCGALPKTDERGR